MRRLESIRWTVELAASEFGRDRKTVTKRLKAAGVLPGNDDRYSTAQIVASIFSDKDAEELRETTERADKLALANAKTRRDLIELPVVESAWADIVLAARSKFTGLPSKLQSRLGLTEPQTRELEKQIDEALGELSKAPDYSPKETSAKEDE